MAGTTITVVTTETYTVAGDREANILVDFMRQVGSPYGSNWSLSDLPQVGESKYAFGIGSGEIT